RYVAPHPAQADAGSTGPGRAASAQAKPVRGKAARTKRSLAASAFSAGVMSIVALMAVSVTAPAEAVAAASDSIAVTTIAPEPVQEVIKPEEIQAFVAPAEGQVVELDREQNYALTTFEQIAIESGIKMSSLFVNDANSAIQWPFAVGVGMSYGYGMRSGRMHQGIDFTPGSGAQIQAVADGTVRLGPAGGGYGVHVYVDHVIDGQRISSHYAHMQVGSLQVVDGQQVKVGDPIGKVGNAGRSFGAHLHFELLVNGTEAIDPLPWLQKHAGGWQG
ncbi:MAG: M23 family metallopeptidase, partial [Microbacteriaceae bacterium]|nr:M23 family metallopeptidase [Microbacteriaceae bacterium]